MTDFRYYRCSGTDAYRFGGERICSNTQIRADTLENRIWENVCEILMNPEILEQEEQDSSEQQWGTGDCRNADWRSGKSCSTGWIT